MAVLRYVVVAVAIGLMLGYGHGYDSYLWFFICFFVTGKLLIYLIKRMIRGGLESMKNVRTGEYMPGPFGKSAEDITRYSLFEDVVIHFKILFDVHKTWRQLVEKYGSVLCIFILHKPVIIVTDPKLVNDVMVGNWKNFSRPNDYFDSLKLIQLAVKGSLPRAEGKEWSKLTRIMIRGFKYSFLREMVPFMIKYSDKLVEKWKVIADEPQGEHGIQIHPYLSNLTLDVIGRIAFGFEFNAQEGGSFVPYAERFMQELTNPFAYLPVWHLLPTPGNLFMKKSMRLLHTKALKVISERRKKLESGELDETEKKDLLHILLAKDPDTGEGLDDQTIVANSIFIMVAGHESTAVCLAYTIYLLATHESVQSKARKLIDQAMDEKNGEEFTFDDYRNLEYIECIIKESLRIWPPAPFNIRKSCEDTHLGDYSIPNNTYVFMPVREIHRGPAFEDADSFIPERWLPENAENLPKGAYLPFNIGVHNCIGQRFAMVELRLVLTKLLRNFIFKPVKGFAPTTCIHFMKPKYGVQVFIENRKDV